MRGIRHKISILEAIIEGRIEGEVESSGSGRGHKQQKHQRTWRE